jgi:hypothetical protein
MLLNGTIEPCGETPPVGRFQPPQGGLAPCGFVEILIDICVAFLVALLVPLLVALLVALLVPFLGLQGQPIVCASISVRVTKRRVIRGNIAHHPLSASLDRRLIQLAAFCDLVSVLLTSVSRPKMNFQ